jgi:hypothetical protein
MAAVTSIYYASGWGSSFSGTLNLPQQMLAAVAQVALTNTLWDTTGYCEAFLTGYSANGNPVSVSDHPAVLGIQNVDSFSFGGDASTKRPHDHVDNGLLL